MIAPYWTNGDLTIYHGDAREVLPQLTATVDLVLTDPPYGIDGGKGNDNRKRGKGAYRATNWHDTPEYVTAVCVEVVRWGIANIGRVIITPGNRMMDSYPVADDKGCFWTPAAKGCGTWGYTSFNPILYYGRDPRLGKGRWPTGMQITEPGSCDWHPCPKPIDAWQWLLCKGSLEGETVLDPFAGAFTTLLAAQRSGRKAIGIEIEEYYCERGAERLAQTVMFSPACVAPLPDPQMSMFDVPGVG